MTRKFLLLFFSFILISSALFATDPLSSEGDDGYKLCLKHEPVADPPSKLNI